MRPKSHMPGRCPTCHQHIKGIIRRCPERCPICTSETQCEDILGHAGMHHHWDRKAKHTAYWKNGAGP